MTPVYLNFPQAATMSGYSTPILILLLALRALVSHSLTKPPSSYLLPPSLLSSTISNRSYVGMSSSKIILVLYRTHHAYVE